MKSIELKSFNSERLNFFSFNVRNKIRMPTLANFIQYSIESPNLNNQAKKKKDIQIEKEVKLSVCR